MVALEGDEPAYSEDGVDLTLIRWMLPMTPAERLEMPQQAAASLLDLRHGKGFDELPVHPADLG